RHGQELWRACVYRMSRVRLWDIWVPENKRATNVLANSVKKTGTRVPTVAFHRRARGSREHALRQVRSSKMKLASRLTMGAGVLALSTGVAAAAPAVVQNDLNLRAGPGVEFPVVAAMPAGTPIDVTRCQASWCRVAFNGTVGWASRAYLGLGGGAV